MISIIIPVYNHSKELKKCLESIFEQTFKDYEIIVVDDGSNFRFQISDLKFKNNAKIKFIRQKHSGANVARNRGFRESNGEFLLFCDADIIMKKDMLGKMINCLKDNPDVSYIYSSFKFGWKKFKLWEFNAKKLKETPYIHTTSLIRRAHFPKFDAKIKKFQDWDLFLTMLKNGHIGKWIPEFLFSIKVRRGGMSVWLPSFLYKVSWLKSVKKYKKFKEIIRKKHNL